MREGFAETLYARVLGFWPYRCNACDLRYFDRRRVIALAPVKAKPAPNTPRRSTAPYCIT
jgi:hypothetical protein